MILCRFNLKVNHSKCVSYITKPGRDNLDIMYEQDWYDNLCLKIEYSLMAHIAHKHPKGNMMANTKLY